MRAEPERDMRPVRPAQDVEPVGVEGLSLPPAQRYGMTVDSLEVVFRGRCSNCAEHG